MAFDYQKAIADGATDAEISDYLASKHKFDVGAARKDGAPDSEIVQHLLSKEGANTPKQTALPTQPSMNDMRAVMGVDSKPLSVKRQTGETVVNTLAPAPAMAVQGAGKFGGDLVAWVGDAAYTGGNAIRSALNMAPNTEKNALQTVGKNVSELFDDRSKKLAEAYPLNEQDEYLASGIRGGLVSTGDMALTLPFVAAKAKGLMKGGMSALEAYGKAAPTAINILATKTAADAYDKYTDRGHGFLPATAGAITEGLIEKKTEDMENLPFFEYLTNPKKQGLKALGVAAAKLGIVGQFTEQLATLGQDMTDKVMGDPNMTLDQKYQTIADHFNKDGEDGLTDFERNARQTMISTATMNAVMGGVGGAGKMLNRNKQQPTDPSATTVDSTADREAALAEQRRAIPIGPDTDLLNPARQAAAIPTPYTGLIEDSEAATPIDRLYSELARMGRENASGLGDIIPGRDVVVPVAEDFDMVGSATPAQAIPVQEQAPIELTTDDMLTPPTAIPTTAGMYGIPDTQFGAIPTGAAPSADSQVLGEQIDAANLTVGQDVALDRFTKQSPVAPPDNPAFLKPTGVVQNKDGSYTIAQPKVVPNILKPLAPTQPTGVPPMLTESHNQALALLDADIANLNRQLDTPLKSGRTPREIEGEDGGAIGILLRGAQEQRERVLAGEPLEQINPKLAARVQPTGVPGVQAASSNQSLSEETKPLQSAEDNKDSIFSGAMAADYLLTGGFDVMLSTEYLLQAYSGLFQKSSSKVEQIRKKYVQEIKDRGLDNVQDFVKSDLYAQITAEMQAVVAADHGDSAAVADIFNDVAKYPTGMPPKVGDKISKKIEALEAAASAPSEVAQPQTPLQPANTDTKYELPKGWKSDGTTYTNKAGDRATRKKDGTWNVHDVLGGAPDNVPTLDDALEALAANEEITLKERTDVSAPKAKESGSASGADKTGASSGKPEGITTISNISKEVSAISGAVTEYWRGLGFGKLDIATIKGQIKEWYGLGKKAPLEGAAGKTIDDAIELAIVNKAREIATDQTLDVDAKYNAIKTLYDNQPNLAARDSQSVTNQAYSTPAPISFVMQEYLGAFAEDSLSAYEPTAGTGMLVFGFNPENVDVNELGDIRVQALESQGFNRVTQENGANNAVENGLSDSYDRVVANPPFGKADTVMVDGFPLTKLEHQIVADALSAMNEDGKAAFIIGGHNFHDVMTGSERDKMLEGDRVFFNWLYSNYNVEHNIDVDGSTYGKQGTKWGIRVITVNGRKQEGAPKTYAPKKGDPAYQRASTVDELRAILKGEAANGTQSDERTAGDMQGVSGDRTEPTTGDTRPDGDSTGRSGNEPAKSPEGADAGKPEEVAGDVGSGRAVGQDDTGTQEQPGSESGRTNKRLKPEYEGFDSVALQAIIDVLGEDAVYDAVPAEPTMQDIKAGQRRTKDAIKQVKRTISDAQKTAQSSTAQTPRTAAEQVADAFADFSLTEDDAEARWKKALPAVQKALDEAISKANMATAKVDDLVRGFVTDFVTQVKTALEKIGRTAQDIARSIGAIAPRLNKFVTESRSYIQDKINQTQQPKEPRKTNEHQTPYEPVSKGPSGYTLVPKNTAQDLRDALLNIQAEHGGDLDAYIMKELQYGSMAELHEAFAAEQIDALAMALHNMDKGKGMIIGDMTGIGKGRVVAGIMRYAILNNKVPVFVTEKPKLFSDMWRDVIDTDSSDMVKPFLMASDTDGHLIVTDKDGKSKVVQKVLPKNASALGVMRDKGKAGLEELGNNAIFTTYSQFNKSNTQRSALRAVAPDSIIILDESHNAGGEDSSNNAKMTTGQFFRSDDILGATQGVVYSSATFAKRPDNMPLYFRTAMGDSGMSPGQITNAMERGGVALQQFVSNLLTKAGAMIRREQDFSKIAMFERKVLTESKADVYAKSDSVTVNVRDMMEFAERMRDEIDWTQIAVDDGHAAEVMQDGAEVGGTEFSSGVWNLINQMQLSMKAEGVVQEALKAIQEGRSPVIGLMNTMESFLNDFAEQNGLSRGDVADFSFNDVLSKMLRNGLRYTIKDPAGKRTHHYMSLDKLEEVHPGLFNMYHAINDALYELDLEGMPASPIDYIKSRLAKEGHKTREITGRNLVITEDENGVPVLANRTDKDRNDSVNGFNSGEVAVLILNKAGSTGLSLHPTNKTANKKPRRMILAQADLDINVVVQMLGRIFRKGQIQDPEYVMLSTALPSETRPSIVLEKKLQSLNANTTSNDKSGYSSEIPDMINKYGDRVFREWIQRNPDMATLLGIDLGDLDRWAPVAAGDTFKKFSGRMGLMAAAEQERFWAETVEEYKSLIAELDALGMNDLVAKDLDMKAITKSKLTIHQGTNEDNPFMSSAIMEEVSVLMPGKPYTKEQVQEKIDEYLDGLDTKERGKAMVAQAREIGVAYGNKQRETIERIDASNPELDDQGNIKDMKIRRERATAAKNLEQVQASFGTFQDLIRSVGIGQVYDLTMGDGETLAAVPYAIKIEKSTAGNPLSGSKIKIFYAVPNGTKHITVGMNRESVWSDAAISNHLEFEDDWADMTAGSSMRKTRHIVTGNMLQAFDLIKTRAQMVNFTREGGTMDQGILLPAGANIDQLTAFETATPERAAEYLANTYNPSVRDAGNDITLFVTRGRVTINIPASQVKGAKFFTDPALQQLTGVLARRSGKMAATFDIRQALPVLQRLHELGSRFQIPRQSQAQVMFSQATSDVGAGVSMANLKSAVATMQQMFPGVNIVVHNSPADVSWAPPTARGAYYKGEVHLFRSNIKDSSQAALTVLAHEFTHHGLDNMGAKGKQLLNQIALAHADEVKKIMAIRKWKDTPENRVRAANELVAQHGETKLKPNWWNKVREFVQSVISKITGKPVRLSLVDEAIREIRSQATPQYGAGFMLDPAFMTAWHGSPHDHDKFSTDKIGTGEGAQAYGYGLYFAGNKEVAEWYRDKLASRDNDILTIDGIPLDEYPFTSSFTANYIRRFNGTLKSAIYAAGDDYRAVLKQDDSQSKTRKLDELGKVRTDLRVLIDSNREKEVIIKRSNPGRLYQVELAPAEDEYLLWDKPLSQQSEKVIRPLFDKASNEIAGQAGKKVIDASGWYGSDGRGIYRDIVAKLGSEKAASEYLHSLGIRGIKYLDGNSRSGKKEDYNYVIFNDEDVTIEAKFSLAGDKNNPSNQNIKDDTVNSKGVRDNDTGTERSRIEARAKELGVPFQAALDVYRGNGGTSRENLEALKRYATEKGLIVDVDAFYAEWEKGKKVHGGENTVLFRNGYAEKLNDLGYHNGDISEFLDRMVAHNNYFPSAAYELVGFVKNGEQLLPMTKQKFVAAATDVKTSLTHISKELKASGFRLADPEAGMWITPDGKYEMFDAGRSNVITDANGNLHFIDAVFLPVEAAEFSQTTDDVSMVRKAYEWAITTAKEFVTSPAKALGDKYRMERYQTAGAIDAHNIEARLLLNRLTPLRESSNSSQKQVVYDFLTTVNADPSAITNPDVRAAAVEAKQKIMDIGETLVQMGLMKRETLEKRDGSYLPRLYMYHLLGTEEASRIEMLSGGKTLDFGFLNRRNDLLSEEIRTNLLHEIKDPAYLVFMALSRPQKDMATYEWLASIAANPDWAMPKQLAEWNMSENPTYLIGNDIQYTINDDGTYSIDQRIVKHERIAHKNVDLAFIKQTFGPNNATYIAKNASAEWQTIGQIKFRMNNKGGFELSVAVKRVTDVTHTSIHPDDLDGIVGDKRADWMRTGRMTTLNGKSVPVRTKDGKRVTAFWLAAEAKRLQHVLAHDRGMAASDRAKSQRIIDRMYDLANATAAAMGYPMDADGNIIPKMPDGWKQIPQSKRYGKLSGLVVRREVYNDLVGKIGRDRDQMTKVEKFFSPDADGVLMQAHQTWKKYKTTYNIPTHITNFTSNAVMTHLFTDMNLREIPAYMMMAVQSILNKDQYWNYAVRNGITSASFTNNELGRANMELIEYMASQESTNATPMEKIAHFADILRAKKEKADQVAGDLYQMSETIWKIAIMRHQMDKHGIPAKQAALIAHDTLFDYSDVGPALRFLRQSYLGVPFATFMVKSSEMIVKKFIEDTTKSKAALTKPGTYGDKAMALWVATRFTRKMAVWNALMLAAPYTLASMIGLDGDDWEDYQKVMPQFFADKLHPMIMPLKDGDGRLTFFDLGKFTPWGPAGNVIKPVLRGDLTKAAKNAGFMQTPLVEAIVALKTGKDAFTGKDIWEDTDTPAEKFGGALKFIYNLYAPSMIAYGHGPAYKTWHAFSGEVNPKTGDPKSNTVDAVGSWMGTGMRTMNVESERQREIDTRELAIAKLRGKETIAIRSAKANDGDVRQVREHYREKIDKLKNELHEYKKGAKFDRSKF